jgi:AraC-like DNA-binding protein
MLGDGVVLSASRRVITTIDEFVDPVASARTAPMALRPGAIRAEWVRADLGKALVEVGEYSFPIATRGETLADRTVILAPLRRAASGHFNGEALAPGVLHGWGEEAEVAGATTGPLQFGIMSFATETLDRTARVLGVDLDLPKHGKFHTVRAVEWARMREVFDMVWRTDCDAPKEPWSEFGAVAVGDMLVELVVRAFSADVSDVGVVREARLNSVRVARACEDQAARARYHGVTLADLCAAAGASERRVRLAFSECYGMSPTAYLRVAALHEVRHALLEGPLVRDAVSRAACDFGFWHLSRFAGQYRALFGEPPSATLDRRSHAAAS